VFRECFVNMTILKSIIPGKGYDMKKWKRTVVRQGRRCGHG